jgi:uncharacterized membrane protein required for colicin V production
MPVLASLIASLFGGIAAFFVEHLTKKILTVAAAVAAFAVSFAALMLMFNTLVAPLVQAMFSTQYGQFLGLAFPPMAGTCLAAIAAAWGGCALYKLKIQSIKMSASA